MKGKLFITLQNEIKNILFSEKCVICGLYNDKSLCASCLEVVKSKITLLKDDNKKVYSLFIYEGLIVKLVHLMKYGGYYNLGYILGSIMGENLRNFTNIQFDGITCVPLHKRDLLERGYNQSKALLEGFILTNPIENYDKYLKKIRITKPQVGLSANQRRENLKGAFLSTENVSGKKILLIDDVYTTGETIKSCCQELKKKGALLIVSFTLCKHL